MHDLPYLRAHQLGPEVTACMVAACLESVNTLGGDRSKLLLGVQVLAGGNEQALAVAKAAGRTHHSQKQGFERKVEF